ncbi:NAD-P-binding protein [Trametes polyzona]|nr:NAD-P-binding protein [Trametes polyzona]
MSSDSTRPSSWLITGASRGIGLELVRQLLESPNNVVIAACRNPEKASTLKALKDSAKGALHIIQLDVSDADNIRAIAKDLETILGDKGLDYLVNNAAIGIYDSAFNVQPQALIDTFRTNVIGPAVLAQVALPFLEKGREKKILNVSSTGGSIASVDSIEHPVHKLVASYSMSKAALNMLTYKQKVERPDLIAITMCPGWVKTDMGGQEAKLEPEESVAGIIKVITSATPADSGKYLRYNGEEIPW